jgi:pyruvate dehydrogenase E2 component (dihydrolipoamide acetyltransferase)
MLYEGSSTPSSPPQAPAAAASAPAVDYESLMMPALSSTMKEGKIVSWNKKIGDKVSSGDVLLVVESGKLSVRHTSYGLI